MLIIYDESCVCVNWVRIKVNASVKGAKSPVEARCLRAVGAGARPAASL